MSGRISYTTSGSTNLLLNSPHYFNKPAVLLAIDDCDEFFGMFTVAAKQHEFVLALLAVPDGPLPTETDGDFHFSDVLRDLDLGHD